MPRIINNNQIQDKEIELHVFADDFNGHFNVSSSIQTPNDITEHASSKNHSHFIS
jgi:hypothetical protein